MNHDKIEVILSNPLVPGTVDTIWRKHCLLCAFDDERCDHVEEILEAFVDTLATKDEEFGTLTGEKNDEEDKVIDLEKKLEEAEERVQNLQGKLAEAKNLSAIDEKTAAITFGRREADEFFLTKLRAAMTVPAKELRATINDIISETIRRVNEP